MMLLDLVVQQSLSDQLQFSHAIASLHQQRFLDAACTSLQLSCMLANVSAPADVTVQSCEAMYGYIYVEHA